MATRSRIGILMKDGSVRSIYHHYDGGPEWLGKRLVENYDTRQKIENLMKHGDISSLETKTDWHGQEMNPPGILSYKMRGEDSPAIKSISEIEYRMDCKRVEYSYLFKDGKWTCRKVNTKREIDLYS